jgi:hypothetical protein
MPPRTESVVDAHAAAANRNVVLVLVHGMGCRRPTYARGLLPAEHLLSVPGEHDWASWRELWSLMLDRDPFEQRAAVVS